MKGKILEKLNTGNAIIWEGLQLLKTYVKDKSIPLEERYEVFQEYEAHLPHKEYVPKFKSKKLNDWLDDFLEEKYQVQKLDELIEFLEDREDKEGEELAIIIKEEFMDQFIWSFTYDW